MTAPTFEDVDAVTFEVVYSGLQAAAQEMSETLARSARSPIIREMLDYSCALFDASGELVAQAENIPSHLGSIGSALRHMLQRHPASAMCEGDVYITNDPYSGGTHTPDVHIFVPAFAGGELIGISGTIAHQVDMGGPNPGTEGYDNLSIFAEGIRIPCLLIERGGRENHEMWEFLLANVRDPVATRGDIRSQVAAARAGARRLTAYAEKYSIDVLRAVMATAMDYSEARLRHRIGQLSGARSEAEGFLDDDGVGGEPVRIKVAVDVVDSSLRFDFTGTAPTTRGGMNVPRAAAVSAALYAVKCFIDPGTPQNAGCFRPVQVVLPEGTLVDPAFPAAVSLRHLAVQRIADTIIRALAQIDPESACAGSFVGFSSIAVETRHPRTRVMTVCQDDLGGGTGAFGHGDGMDAVDTHAGNVALLPAEVCEVTYDIRVRATELITDSGGAGTWRGGLGMRRVYEFVGSPQPALVYAEQTNPRFASWALGDGRTGAPATVIVPDGGRAGKTRFLASDGDVLVLETGGGGGYGDPRERDPQRVLRDVREDRVSLDEATAVYGVAIRAGGVDLEETGRLRGARL